MARPGRLTGYLLCLPAFVLVFGLLLYPVVYDLQLSLTDAHDFAGSGSFVGLANYRRLAGDPVFWTAARNTGALVAFTAAVELLVGVLTALLLWRRSWGRPALFLAVFVPWAFPSSFSAFAWYWLLLPPFHSFYTLQALDARSVLDGIFGSGSWQVLSIGIMSVWRGSSIIAIFLLAGLNAIPEELLDYGRLESRGYWRYLTRVVAPLVRRFLVLAALVAVVVTYLDYVSMYIESGGRILVPVLGTLAFKTGIMGGQTAYAAAVSMTEVPVALVVALVALRLVEPRAAARPPVGDPWRLARAPAPSRAATAEAPRRAGRGTWRVRRRLVGGAALLAILAVVAFHLLPLYYTAIQALRPISEYSQGQILWVFHPDFSTLTDSLENAKYLQWALNTAIVFGSVLVAGTSAALLAGYGLARFRPPGASWLARVMFATYFLPQLAVAVPIFQVYDALRLDNTMLGIVLLYLTLTVPFSSWLFYSYFLGLDREIEEQAWLSGGRLRAFWHVVLPMSWPVVIAAVLFAIGMMGSDVLYSGLFSLSDSTKTLPAGLGVTAIDLDEWANVNAAILLAALPLVAACAALGRYYVRGLQSALVEGA